MQRKIKKVFVWKLLQPRQIFFAVSFKMTGLLKCMYELSLIKIDVSLSLLVKKALICSTQTGEILSLKRFIISLI